MQAMSFTSMVLADVAANGFPLMGQHLVAALAFSVLGVLVLIVSIWLMCKLAPFSIKKEIEEDHNTSLAILMGSVLLGIAIIIAAAIQG